MRRHRGGAVGKDGQASPLGLVAARLRRFARLRERPSCARARAARRLRPCCCSWASRLRRVPAAPHFGGRRHAELFERARHALLEDVLELAPLARGLGAEIAGEAGHAGLRLRQRFFGGLLGLLLHAGAVFHQRLESLAAFLLHLGEGAEPGKPDLLGGVLDAVGFVVGLVVCLVAWLFHKLTSGCEWGDSFKSTSSAAFRAWGCSS